MLDLLNSSWLMQPIAACVQSVANGTRWTRLFIGDGRGDLKRLRKPPVAVPYKASIELPYDGRSGRHYWAKKINGQLSNPLRGKKKLHEKTKFIQNSSKTLTLTQRRESR